MTIAELLDARSREAVSMDLTPVYDSQDRLIAYVNPVQPQPKTVVIRGETHVLHPVGMPATIPPDDATMRDIIAQERARGRLPMWTGRTPALCYAPDTDGAVEPVVYEGRFIGYHRTSGEPPSP